MNSAIDIPKNSREVLRIQREEYLGHDMLNLRVWYDDGSGELRPSKKGVAVKAALIPDLIKALAKVSASDTEAA
ncbi:MAG: transcriptional coactivator p15/PC4 family protein [Pseudomonadota bacterium]